MFDNCPPSLKEILLRLLITDCFVEAKEILEDWRTRTGYSTRSA